MFPGRFILLLEYFFYSLPGDCKCSDGDFFGSVFCYLRLVFDAQIYPSEYGLARMKEEDAAGPQELRELAAASGQGEDLTEVS